MSLDPKNFNRTVIIGGVFAAIMLAFTSVYIHMQSTLKFREYAQRMQNQIEHTWFHNIFDQDSVRVNQYEGKVTAVLFWGTWADASKDMLKELRVLHNQYPEQLVVIAASIRKIKPSVKDYLGDRKPELIYVDGTRAYSNFDVPGVPTMLVFDKKGKFVFSKVGYKEKSDLDHLIKMLK